MGVLREIGGMALWLGKYQVLIFIGFGLFLIKIGPGLNPHDMRMGLEESSQIVKLIHFYL